MNDGDERIVMLMRIAISNGHRGSCGLRKIDGCIFFQFSSLEMMLMIMIIIMQRGRVGEADVEIPNSLMAGKKM